MCSRRKVYVATRSIVCMVGVYVHLKSMCSSDQSTRNLLAVRFFVVYKDFFEVSFLLFSLSLTFFLVSLLLLLLLPSYTWRSCLPVADSVAILLKATSSMPRRLILSCFFS